MTFEPAGPADCTEPLRAAGVVPVVEVDDAGRAVALAQTLEAGGLPIVEVTFRSEAAAAALERVARDVPAVLLIAGIVTSTRQADVARDAGARMLVAPGLNAVVVEHAGRIGLPMLPGVCTPSEVEAELALGLTAVIFPIEPIGGVRYLRALAAPHGWMRWNPTGEITAGGLPDYLAVKSVIACCGSWVAPRAEIAAGRFEGIATRAAHAVRPVRRARPQPLLRASDGHRRRPPEPPGRRDDVAERARRVPQRPGGATLSPREPFQATTRRDREVYDRVGGGDSFASGLPMSSCPGSDRTKRSNGARRTARSR